MKAVVVGGGIGGLSAAIALRRALRCYGGRRIGRTAAIVRRSRRIGRVLQLENPLLCGLRDALIGALPSDVRLGQTDPVVGYTV